MAELREILEKLVYADLEMDKHFLIDSMIDQATAEIKSLLKNKLPQKVLFAGGRNSVITEIEKIVEEL